MPVKYSSNLGPGVLGQSGGFPSGGNPAPGFTLVPNVINSSNVNYIATIMAHEMGHCIGMRHTDYYNRAYSCGGSASNEGASSVGAILIPGTPSSAEPNSWMLACVGNGVNRPVHRQRPDGSQLHLLSQLRTKAPASSESGLFYYPLPFLLFPSFPFSQFPLMKTLNLLSAGLCLASALAFSSCSKETEAVTTTEEISAAEVSQIKQLGFWREGATKPLTAATSWRATSC